MNYNTPQTPLVRPAMPMSAYAHDKARAGSSATVLRAERTAQRAMPDALLTTYKSVVDISKWYGLSKADFEAVQAKIQKQKAFLQTHYIQNNSTGQLIQFADCMVSSNHNPHRYHAQIYNRIETLEREAKLNNLTPVFITLTLPSAFHRLKQTRDGRLVPNAKYNGTTPKEAVKVLTKMFDKLRHDRSLKELPKSQRIYYRVNEPHKDGTPHAHYLLFIPQERIERVQKAFERFFNRDTNKFEKDIKNATAYLMKYINKTLPNSKEKMSTKEQYLNAWYSHNRILHFVSSKSLAPVYLYKLLHRRYTLFAVTQIHKRKEFNILAYPDSMHRVEEIWDGEELLYMRFEDFTILHERGMAA